MNEAHWIRLSQARAANAQFLLNAGRWPAAYYLAGYAVECRLKACIVQRVRNDPGIVFDKSRPINQIWTHDISVLSNQAGLSKKISDETNSRVVSNWLLVKEWKETSRYDFPSDAEATDLVLAITEPIQGVLAWIDQNA